LTSIMTSTPPPPDDPNTGNLNAGNPNMGDPNAGDPNLKFPYMSVSRTLVDARDTLRAQIEANEHALRRLGAQRLHLYAQLLDIAGLASDDHTPDAIYPTGARGELEYRSIRAEIATSLKLTEYQVNRDIGLAHSLTTDYQPVWRAYETGSISERHAQVIIDAGSIIGCDPTVDTQTRRSNYIHTVLPEAIRTTPAQLRPIARRIAEQFAHESLDTRHETARVHRRVLISEAEDGMADLYAHLPAVEAYAIKHRLTQMGQRVAHIDRSRTRDEIRTDIFTDLLLTGTPAEHETCAGLSDGLRPEAELGISAGLGLGGVKAQVQIFGSHEMLELTPVSQSQPDVAFRTGHDSSSETDSSADSVAGNEPVAGSRSGADEPRYGRRPRFPAPPELVGYGPIDRRSAQKLAGHAPAWELITTEPTTGTVLTVNRYRPSKHMRRLLGARDVHCRFPGCRVPLARCDLDHTIDAARGGATATDNLSYLCRSHHTLKHHTGWRVTQQPAGVLEWTSPAGRTHVERPPSRVRFSSPDPRDPPDPPDPPW
jgi:hypothetical protein